MTGSVWVVAPLICMAVGAFAIYLVAQLLSGRLRALRNALLASITALVFATALTMTIPLWMATGTSAKNLASSAEHPTDVFPTWGREEQNASFLRADPGAVVVMGVALGLGMLVSIYSARYLSLDRRYATYYPLLLLLVIGLSGMVLAADLFNLYLFCELMSVAAYVLVAFRRHTDTAIEAGFKYLVMGSLGTVIILMGISFVFRETGTLALPSAARAPGPWTRMGMACFLVGLGIKSAIVPLHTWLPDAHGRAPSSISAMLSGIVIQSAFYTMLKVGLGLGFAARSLGTLLIWLSLLNMTLGNGMALVQTNTKRMLGYSTIAQMGYMMFSIGVGLRHGIPAAIQAGFYFLIAHAAIKGLAFLCKGVCHFYCDTTTIDQLRGTFRQLPLVAVAMSVALGGLAAVPPLAGFTGKWFILVHAMRSVDVLVYAGIVVLLLNSLLSLGYYLPLIATLFSRPPEGADTLARIPISLWMAVPLVILGGLVIATGLYPGPWLDGIAAIGVHMLSFAR